MSTKAERIQELFPEVKQISDPELAQKVVDIWVEIWEESGWSDLTEVPKSEDVPHRSLVPHVRGVTQQAVAIAEIVERLHSIEVNRDHVIAVALLHDVSKPVENESSGGSYHKTRLGKMLNHGWYGGHKALEKGLPMEVVHAVLNHSHNASARPPATLEGIIVHYADMADSDALKVDAGKKTILAGRWIG